MLYFLSILGIFTVATALRIPEERIVNGKSIEISEAPYQVSILNSNKEHICGGSILSNRIILTAAHCVRGELPEDLSIVAGSKYWNKGGQRIKVEDFKAHEAYIFVNRRPIPNDLAVILLSQPLEYNSKVQPIAIAKEIPKVGDLASASGWGSISYEEEKRPKDLQGVENTIIKVSDDFISTNCTIKGIWIKDSGGPLVVKGYLVGVSAFGYPYRKALYSNTVHLFNWIENVVKSFVSS